MTRPHRYHRTPQREAILEYVTSRCGHFSAEEIHAALRRRHPRLSTSSVYRNLHVLVAQGKLRVLRFGSGQDLYDARTDQHYHLLCRACGELTDVELPELTEAVTRAEHQLSDFLIESHTLMFNGLCKGCEDSAPQSRSQN